MPGANRSGAKKEALSQMNQAHNRTFAVAFLEPNFMRQGPSCIDRPPTTDSIRLAEGYPSYSNEKERVRAFIAGGGGSRATYFNHARKLRPKVEPPRIVLENSPPKEPKEALLDDSLINLLRGRRGDWENN